ncbi:hypothetical protein F4861DRAFT_544497 [Xylaria intraflava]|nr:hypothetical protein F4861DRAFT_544497 [Xylaria intraflava]
MLGGSGFVLESTEVPTIGNSPALNQQEVARVINIMSAPVLARRVDHYIRICPKITVIIGGPGVGESVTGVIDTGAQSSILVHSYVLKHKIPVRRSNLNWRGFTTGTGSSVVGVSETQLWIAGRSIHLPLYIIDHKVATFPLLLGMNFIAMTKMALYYNGEYMMCDMTFDGTHIIVPVTKASESVPMTISQLVDESEN